MMGYPKRNKDFSRAVFAVAPGLTVKDRLKVLYPGDPANYYDEFQLCPSKALRQKLNQAEVLVENWHTLMPLCTTLLRSTALDRRTHRFAILRAA